MYNEAKKMAVLVGGSDLFSGMRGISKGTKIISREIKELFDNVIVINYNYFLDFGSSLKKIYTVIEKEQPQQLVLYGYSKGGEVMLKLARLLENKRIINLLVTVDIANGPWSKNICRTIPGNVQRNINVYQTTARFPLKSFGLPNSGSANTCISNIDLTGKTLNERKVTHSSIELLIADDVIAWIKNAPNCNISKQKTGQ